MSELNFPLLAKMQRRLKHQEKRQLRAINFQRSTQHLPLFPDWSAYQFFVQMQIFQEKKKKPRRHFFYAH